MNIAYISHALSISLSMQSPIDCEICISRITDIVPVSVLSLSHGWT